MSLTFLWLTPWTGLMALYDLLTEKIPNRWIAAGLLTAAVSRGFLTGADGVLRGACAGILLAAALFPLFSVGALGAGDVKLLCVCGFALGARQGAFCLAFSFLCGALYGAGRLLRQGCLKKRMYWAIAYIAHTLRQKRLFRYDAFVEAAGAQTRGKAETLPQGKAEGKIHFAAAVFAGLLVLEAYAALT